MVMTHATEAGVCTQRLIVFNKNTASEMLRILFLVTRISMTDTARPAYRCWSSNRLSRSTGRALEAYRTLAPVCHGGAVSGRHGIALADGEVTSRLWEPGGRHCDGWIPANR